MKRIVWMGCISYFMIGLATVVLGALLPELLQDYDRSYSNGGQLVFTQFFGFFIGVVIAPKASQRLGYQLTILLGVLSLVVVHGSFLFHPHWYLVMLLAALNGFGFGMTQTAIGTLMLESTNNGAVTMSRLEVAFGIGALLMPIMSSILIIHYSWIWSFAIVIVFAIINLALWSNKNIRNDHTSLVSHLSPTINTENSSKTNTFQLNLSKLAFFICFVFLDCYGYWSNFFGCDCRKIQLSQVSDRQHLRCNGLSHLYGFRTKHHCSIHFCLVDRTVPIRYLRHCYCISQSCF